MEGLRLFFGDIMPETFVAWAPLFHNMGILSLVFMNMYINARSIIMSPLSFVEKPADWFRAVTEYKGDLIFGPNSAYDFCTRIISDEELMKFDLSTIRYAANGSEPINYKILQAFSNKFKKCGFKHSAFCLGYGLAESTCFVSASRFSPGYLNIDYEGFKRNLFIEKSDGNSKDKQVVGVGKPFCGVEAIVVNPNTDLLCNENEIGELLLKSGSVVDGYWKMEEESNRVFKASVEGKEGFYMRTGDLAALYKGEIYIVGRLKEIIIINGHNIVPQDIEICVWENVPELKGCPITSFAVNTEGKERFATCIEVSEKIDFNYHKLCNKINRAIHRIFDICPYTVLNINPSLTKSSIFFWI
jgi:acyl-CoA synthetase (AMP-forming)/AMP-acid ligase II